jgi:outer membrane protein OmpA-like peptidoglycan-associated protein
MRFPSVFQISFMLGCTCTACASTAPPAGLVDARTAYTHAAQGPASQLAPADLHSARQALAAAEASFANDAEQHQVVNDLAYVAQRRAQIADATAGTLQSAQDEAKAVEAMHAGQAKQVKTATAQLSQAHEQIALQEQQLDTERENRVAADQRAAQATAALQKFATVKQEARGLVITLSGSVLFASGKSELQREAQVRLNSVADALTQQDPYSTIAVEGYTDSQGTAAYNEYLSQRRAEVVREYLVSRGITTTRVTSHGFGPTRAIADNSSPEGRANNRRVEIVVAPAPAKPL